MAIIRRPQNAQFYRDLAGDGKRSVLAAGIETGAARPARQPMSKMDESVSEAYKPMQSFRTNVTGLSYDR
ncbi:hypothetical protein CFB89_04130 [Burkholderia sp. AU16741]|nr:hypothetical protein CFB89_04130 [Burkholderia sp. AU16741]